MQICRIARWVSMPNQDDKEKQRDYWNPKEMLKTYGGLIAGTEAFQVFRNAIRISSLETEATGSDAGNSIADMVMAGNDGIIQNVSEIAHKAWDHIAPYIAQHTTDLSEGLALTGAIMWLYSVVYKTSANTFNPHSNYVDDRDRAHLMRARRAAIAFAGGVSLLAINNIDTLKAMYNTIVR